MYLRVAIVVITHNGTILVNDRVIFLLEIIVECASQLENMSHSLEIKHDATFAHTMLIQSFAHEIETRFVLEPPFNNSIRLRFASLF